MAERRRERDHPFWMSYEVQKKVKHDLFLVQPLQRKRVQYLRETNRMLQCNSADRKKLIEIMSVNERIKQQETAKMEDIMNRNVMEMWVKELQEQKQNLETEFMERCREQYEGGERFAYLPGPVGDLPVHNCLLLGLKELTKKLVDELHSPSVQHVDLLAIHDVNTPYKSDLDAWKDMQFLRTGHPYDDRGLFTGQTLLHIAVGQGDTEMVRWLIEDKGASIAAQAVGAFFKPKQLILPKTESTIMVARRQVTVERGPDHWRYLENPDGECDFGEFPLSFAAAMGQVKMMEVIKDAMTQRIRTDERGSYYDHLVKNPVFKKIREKPLQWSREFHACFLMLNVQDSDGNTPLHKAVEFNRIEAIDWLLAHGGYPSLLVLNSLGYSPVTLAAKCGHVVVFNHLMESEHLTEISWRFGSVARTMLNLEQLDTYVVQPPVGAAKEVEAPLVEELLKPMLQTSHPGWRSAIQIIVDDEKEEFAHDAFFIDIIDQKWNKFARKMFLARKLIPHYTLTIIFIIMLQYRSNEVRTRWEQAYLDGCLPAGTPRDEAIMGGILPQYVPGLPLKCITDKYETTKDIRFWVSDLSGNLRARPWEGGIYIFQLLVQIGFCLFTMFTGWKWKRANKRDKRGPEKGWYMNFRILLFKNLTFIFDYCAAIFLILATLFRLLAFEDQELQMLANASVFIVIQCVLLLIPFRRIGVLIITMFRILTDDVLKFLIIYITVCLGFTFALTVVIDYPDVLPANIPREGYFWHHFWANFYDLVLLSLAELESEWQPTPYRLEAILKFVFALFACILLLNFLIAMMAQTFQGHVEDTWKTWVFPFAHNVLRLERMLPKALRAQQLYRIGEPREKVTHRSTNFESETFYTVRVKEKKSAGKPPQAGTEEKDLSSTDGGVHESVTLDPLFQDSLDNIDEFCLQFDEKLKDLLQRGFTYNPKSK